MVPAVWLLIRYRPTSRHTHPVSEAVSWWQSAAVLALYAGTIATSVYEIHLAGPPLPPLLAGFALLGLAALAGIRYVVVVGLARTDRDAK